MSASASSVSTAGAKTLSTAASFISPSVAGCHRGARSRSAILTLIPSAKSFRSTICVAIRYSRASACARLNAFPRFICSSATFSDVGHFCLISAAVAFAQGLKARAQAVGRARDSLKVMPGISVYVGESRAEAEDKFALLQSFIDPAHSVGAFKAFLDWDLTGADLDGPPSPPPFTEGWQSRQQLFYQTALSEGLTIRQLVGRISAARGHWVVVGTPRDVADQMQDWFEAGAADGFNLLSPTFPHGLDDFIELVLPELRRRGLFPTEYEGRTLRDHLGLARPEPHRESAVPTARYAIA